MGNQPSNNKINDTSNSFGDIIDYIASNYIITMNFKNLQKMYNKDYCNKLIILTKDILKNNFNEIQISNINNRINKSGSAAARNGPYRHRAPPPPSQPARPSRAPETQKADQAGRS